MSYGFELFNDAGAVMVDSDNRTTLFSDIRNITGLTDIGYYQVKNPFGGDYPFGFLPNNSWPQPGYLYWYQLNPGAFAMPGGWCFQNNSGRIIRTSRNVAIQSGYLDVLNARGQLVWSAKSAELAPRIRGFIDLPANSPVDSSTVSFNVNFNPWILMNALPGNISDDGAVVGYSGLITKWTGTQIQCRYVSKKQPTYAQSFGVRGGLRVPYAQFTNY